MIKFAIIGMGIRGKLFADIISQHQDAELVAVCDIDDKALDKAAKNYGVRCYKDWKELLNQEELDAAYIATPDDTHRMPTILAAERGLHILIEKPLATKIEDCFEMKSAIEKAGVKSLVAYNNRWNPNFIRAKEAIDAGELGKIISMNVRAVDTLYVPTKMLNWAGKTTPAWFLLSHALDLALWLTGKKAQSVYAKGIKGKLTGMGIDTYDHMHVNVEYQDGVLGFFEAGWILPDTMPSLVDHQWEIIGNEGVFYVNQHEQMVRKATKEKYSFPTTISQINIHGTSSGRELFCFNSFLRSIKEDLEPVVKLDEALEVTKILEGLHVSIKEGKPIKIG